MPPSSELTCICLKNAVEQFTNLAGPEDHLLVQDLFTNSPSPLSTLYQWKLKTWTFLPFWEDLTQWQEFDCSMFQQLLVKSCTDIRSRPLPIYPNEHRFLFKGGWAYHSLMPTMFVFFCTFSLDIAGHHTLTCCSRDGTSQYLSCWILQMCFQS